MLKEVHHVLQHAGETPRRVFTDPNLELVTWQSLDGTVVHFHLAYDIIGTQRVIEFKNGGLYHFILDRGPQDHTQADRTALLRPTGEPDLKMIRTLFDAASRELPGEIREAVESALAR